LVDINKQKKKTQMNLSNRLNIFLFFKSVYIILFVVDVLIIMCNVNISK